MNTLDSLCVAIAASVLLYGAVLLGFYLDGRFR